MYMCMKQFVSTEVVVQVPANNRISHLIAQYGCLFKSKYLCNIIEQRNAIHS